MDRKLLKRDPEKILIVKPSSLGDIVHSLVVLAALHKRFPLARIDWVVAKGFEGLLEGHPLLTRLWIIRKDQWKVLSHLRRTARELKELFLALRTERYDLVIDLQGLLRSGIITQATKSPVRLGLAEAREGSRLFYTNTVAGGRDIHAVDRYLKLAAAVGCDISSVSFPFPPAKDSAEIGLLIEKLGDYAILVPGARKPVNRWPAERFGALAAALPIKTLVLGSRADAALADSVVAASGGKALSLAGQTSIPELIQLIRGGRFMVCNDTGPMHIAAACAIPVVALFGPANPVRTGPYGSVHAVIKADVPCAPCYKKECSKPPCMETISVSQVVDAIQMRGLINGQPRQISGRKK